MKDIKSKLKKVDKNKNKTKNTIAEKLFTDFNPENKKIPILI